MIDSWGQDAAATAIRFLPPLTGLWKGSAEAAATGTLTCPDGAVIAHPSPNGGWAGSSNDRTGECALVKAPAPPGDSRSSAEVAADDALHRQVRLYGLISGWSRELYGKSMTGLHGDGAPGYIYIDPAQVRWHVSVSTVHASGGCTATVKIRRFGHFDPRKQFSTLTKMLTAPAGYAPNDGPLSLLAHGPDGAHAVFGSMRLPPGNPWGAITFNLQSWPTGFWHLELTGSGDEALPDFGLGFAWVRDVPQRITERETHYVNSGGLYHTGNGFATWSGDAFQNNGTWTYTPQLATVPPQNTLQGWVVVSSSGNAYERFRQRAQHDLDRTVYTYRLWPLFDESGQLLWLTLRHENFYSLDHVIESTMVQMSQQVIAGVPQPLVVNGTHTETTTYDQVSWNRWTLSIGEQVLYDETFNVVDTHTSGVYSLNVNPGFGGAGAFNVPVADYHLPYGVDSTVDYNAIPFRWTFEAAPHVGLPIPWVSLSVVRYSPNLFGAFKMTWSQTSSGDTGHEYNLVNGGGVAAVSAFVDPCINAGPTPTVIIYSSGQPGAYGRFGTYHPVTHAIAWDTAPVCWL